MLSRAVIIFSLFTLSLTSTMFGMVVHGFVLKEVKAFDFFVGLMLVLFCLVSTYKTVLSLMKRDAKG